MELGEREAQICRLCGQYESIYIDVFGEEGTKRFLGLKIHRKINILIKENDGLPQIVCLRCMGSLEFLCDFHERCQNTQKELQKAEQDASQETYREENDDSESDKENTLSSTYNTKVKTKGLSPDGLKYKKNGLTVNSTSHYRSENKDESNNLHREDKDDCTNNVRPNAQTTVENHLVSKTQSVVDDAVVPDQKAQEKQSNDNNVKCKSPESKNDIPKKTAIRNTRSGSLNSYLISTKKSDRNDGTHSEQPMRRKRGRKSNLQKLKEAALSLNIKRDLQGELDEIRSDGNRGKRRCLQAISTNNEPNISNNTVILSKPQVERAANNKVVNILSSKLQDKTNETPSDSTIVRDSLKKFRTNDKGSEIEKDFSRNKVQNSIRCKTISVTVKQEKVETETSPQSVKSNPFVWIPSDMLIHGQKSPMCNENREIKQQLSRLGPQLEDDTGNSGVSSSTESEHSKSTTPVHQNRVTVIKSSQTNGTIIPAKIQGESSEVVVKPDAAHNNIKNDSKCNVSDSSFTRRVSRNTSFDGSKSSDRSFGKISELISDEQKNTIETYYTVDMSIVNSEKVQKNLTIVDKKNIRCNICGNLYFRMDKCQVHIWSHLEMKPYQCKACDFATVTVSNVRCHIRKSHLKIKPFECNLCEKKYVTAVLLDEHMNTHTGERPFKCKLCDFASASRQMLSYHNDTHKPAKDINCKICGKEFFSRGRLRAHMIIHNKDKVVMCKLCSAYLSSAEALETHHRNMHMQDYVCNVCGKHVKSKKALYNHQSVHAAAKYKCSLCPNVYKSSQILKEHLLKHEGIRKYKCSVCAKTFGQQSHLAAHMAVHSKIRFHCPGCNRDFNRHDNMKIHTKRCKQFLANPQLKKLLIKKERSTSVSKITELNEDMESRDTSNSGSSIEDQTEKSSANVVDDKEKTGMNFCKLGLNIACFETPDKTWTHDDVYKKGGKVMGSAEINVIQIAKVNDALIPENDNLTVLENVLGPESF
ncbi:PREDICTED: zinc finger protein 235-like [Dufourea novaeangliae]|uniref:zinc finger protein 235-like n=1 Tax=Dufourea novaeangliae TaxID=178035 RepID=UPI000767021B|nr:PREDICTED: zinc finger protein 235-like [Dufourea novaeangliae]